MHFILVLYTLDGSFNYFDIVPSSIIIEKVSALFSLFSLFGFLDWQSICTSLFHDPGVTQ